jgi:ankyrin repeat protein
MEPEEAACLHFDVLQRCLGASLALLCQDKVEEQNITLLALAHNKPKLFMRMITLCPQQTNLALYDAVSSGRYDLVQELIKTQYPFDRANEHGVTPLMLAAGQGHEALVNLLLSQGASVRSTDRYGNGILHMAMQASNEATALMLLPLVAPPNQANRFGLTPLMLAAKKGWLGVIRFLCIGNHAKQAVDKYGRNALHYAAIHGQVPAIRTLIAHGMSVDAGLPSALQLAALKGQIDAVLALLACGANPLLEDDKGCTFTEYAVMSKKEEMLALIKTLPFFHLPERRLSLLQTAVLYNNKDALCELIVTTQIRHPERSEGSPDIQEMSRCARHDVPEILSTVDKKNGYSLAHLAAINAAHDVIDLILDVDAADLSLKDYAGFTALHYAVLKEDLRMVELLCRAHANINILDPEGNTALHLAAKKGNQGIVMALLVANSDHQLLFNLRNNAQMSAAQVALYNGHIKIAKNLQDAGDKSLTADAFKDFSPHDRKQLMRQHRYLAQEEPYTHPLLQQNFWSKCVRKETWNEAQLSPPHLERTTSS